VTIFDGTLIKDDLVWHRMEQCTGTDVGPRFCKEFLAQERRGVNDETLPGFPGFECTAAMQWRRYLSAQGLVRKPIVDEDGNPVLHTSGVNVGQPKYESNLREPYVRDFYNWIAGRPHDGCGRILPLVSAIASEGPRQSRWIWNVLSKFTKILIDESLRDILAEYTEHRHVFRGQPHAGGVGVHRCSREEDEDRDQGSGCCQQAAGCAG
jgi:hypothetical protein